MKVFGIGLNKTGTTTLGDAFRLMGLRHVSTRPPLLKDWVEGRRDRVWAVVDDHDSFEDWPWPFVYEEAFERYEDARFVLTLRESPEAWLKSLKKHSLRTPPFRHCRKLAYGYDYPFGNEAAHLDFYRRHTEAVTDFFASRAQDRLLTVSWEDGAGWDELCAFTGLPKPDVPFPHARSSEQIAPPSRKRVYANRLLARYFGPV